MSEYIEREAAEKVASKYGCTNGVVIGRHSGLADCIALEIAKLPAADVALVKHGKWITPYVPLVELRWIWRTGNDRVYETRGMEDAQCGCY